MANPQKENGHLDLANELVEQLARINLSAYEWRVLWAVLRKTWGWRKKVDIVPLSQIAEITGIQRPHVVRAKMSLLKKKVLVDIQGKIGFNKDYEQWEIPGYTSTDSGTTLDAKVVPIQATGSTDSGNKSVPIQALSKEKKDTIQKKESKTSPESFIAYWSSKTNLPRVRRMTDERKKKLGVRLEEKDFANHWQETIDKISQSAFCTGNNDRGWKASIDWLLVNSTNYVKVLEGKYNNKPKSEPEASIPFDPEAAAQRKKMMEKIA